LRRIALPKSVNNVLADSMVEYLEWTAGTFAVRFFVIEIDSNYFNLDWKCDLYIYIEE